jgi:hypothetical protein
VRRECFIGVLLLIHADVDVGRETALSSSRSRFRLVVDAQLLIVPCPDKHGSALAGAALKSFRELGALGKLLDCFGEGEPLALALRFFRPLGTSLRHDGLEELIACLGCCRGLCGGLTMVQNCT